MSGGPIMIMAGGTGGHVFPGLAVAEELRAQHGAVVWLGTHRGLEARVVPQNGIDMEWISISGLRGRGVLAWFAAPFRIALAILQVLATFRRRRPRPCSAWADSSRDPAASQRGSHANRS